VLPKSGGCEFTEQLRLSYVFIPLAWDDGKIRAFYPESGKPMYTIHDAHNKGVTAIACTSDNRRVISGGGEEQGRVWGVTPQGQYMKVALKEHKGAVSCIKIRTNNEEVSVCVY